MPMLQSRVLAQQHMVKTIIMLFHSLSELFEVFVLEGNAKLVYNRKNEKYIFLN